MSFKLSGKVVAGLVIGGIVGFIILCLVFFWIGTSNHEIDLKNQATAQQKKNEVVFDKVWKVIQQKAGLASEYASKFKEIYHDIMSERYSGDQKQSPMFRWITEQNPQFSVEMYKEVSDAIESNRAEFVMVQSRLLDIKREHDNLRQKFPSSIVVGGRPALDIKIVTSSKTDEAFRTGKEDDVELFNKK